MPLTLGSWAITVQCHVESREREGEREQREEEEVEQSLDWLIVNSLAQKRIIMIILLLLFVAAFQMKSNTIEQRL